MKYTHWRPSPAEVTLHPHVTDFVPGPGTGGALAVLFTYLKSMKFEHLVPRLPVKYLLYEGDITAADASAFAGLNGVLLQSTPNDEGQTKNKHIAAVA